MSEKGSVPAGLLAFTLDGTGSRVLFEDGQGDSAEPGEVLGSIAGAGAAGVLAEDHVEDPMDAVFNGPVAADACGVFKVAIQFCLYRTGRLPIGRQVTNLPHKKQKSVESRNPTC